MTQTQQVQSNATTTQEPTTSCTTASNVVLDRPRRNFPRLDELVRETAHLNNAGLFREINDLIRNGSSSRSRSNHE